MDRAFLIRRMQRVKSGIYEFIKRNNVDQVNFIIAGAQKGGTTALDVYLREHPEICMADKKELHFFDKEKNFTRKTKYYKYHSNFEKNKSNKLVGEATPIYMYWDDVPRRIWEYNPNMKLLIVLRNPIDRAYSHWNMEMEFKTDDISFWDAISNETDRCRETLPNQHRFFSYIDRGFYSGQLRRLWSFFPKKQVLILKNEYLRNEPKQALDAVCDFLEVSRLNNIQAKNIHSRPYQSKMSDKERKYLKHIFEHEIRTLERILGWDCSDWLE